MNKEKEEEEEEDKWWGVIGKEGDKGWGVIGKEDEGEGGGRRRGEGGKGGGKGGEDSFPDLYSNWIKSFRGGNLQHTEYRFLGIHNTVQFIYTQTVHTVHSNIYIENTDF